MSVITAWFTETRCPIGRCLLLSVLVALSGCKEQIKIESDFAPEAVVVDGRSDDWPTTALHDFPDQKATVGIANDSASLCLLLKFTDPKMARLITTTGLRLEFRDRADSHGLFTLRYHGGPPPESMRPASEKAPPGFDGPPPGFDRGEFPGGDRPGENDDRKRRTFTCEIKDRIIEKEIPVDGAEGPRVAFGIEEGLFCYEFSIPLARGAVRYYGLGGEPGGRLLLTATWGDPEDLNRGDRRPGGLLGELTGGLPIGGGGSPGGGGPTGGGMPGGGPGGGFGDRKLPEKQEVKLVIDLAEGQ